LSVFDVLHLNERLDIVIVITVYSAALWGYPR
jgi:hypothetical protein